MSGFRHGGRDQVAKSDAKLTHQSIEDLSRAIEEITAGYAAREGEETQGREEKTAIADKEKPAADTAEKQRAATAQEQDFLWNVAKQAESIQGGRTERTTPATGMRKETPSPLSVTRDCRSQRKVHSETATPSQDLRQEAHTQPHQKQRQAAGAQHETTLVASSTAQDLWARAGVRAEQEMMNEYTYATLCLQGKQLYNVVLKDKHRRLYAKLKARAKFKQKGK